MDQIIEQIRASLMAGASPESRATGAAACRAALAALEAVQGEPVPNLDRSTADAAIGPAALGPLALLAQLGRLPPERRLDVALDLAVAKLGAMLPEGSPPIEVRSLRFPLVPLGAHVPPGGAR
jgi:hypothetical protein